MSGGRMDPVAYARSWLFVPANRPDRFDKAVATGADVVILDLEDAVPAEEKAAAREHAVRWLRAGAAAAVRINPVGSVHHEDDIAALAGLSGMAGLRAVVVPMAASAPVLTDLGRQLVEVPLVPQIETAEGLTIAGELATVSGVSRLAFGHLDFAVDIDAAPVPEALSWARSALVVASRAAGVAGPIDSVTTDLDDEQVTVTDAEAARRMGFTGKLCVHPRQVGAVNEAMSPSAAEIAWAERILAADASGAARVDGQMVDAPVIARAERIVARRRQG